LETMRNSIYESLDSGSLRMDALSAATMNDVMMQKMWLLQMHEQWIMHLIQQSPEVKKSSVCSLFDGGWRNFRRYHP
jgi:hypothetical protein